MAAMITLWAIKCTKNLLRLIITSRKYETRHISMKQIHESPCTHSHVITQSDDVWEVWNLKSYVWKKKQSSRLSSGFIVSTTDRGTVKTVQQTGADRQTSSTVRKQHGHRDKHRLLSAMTHEVTTLIIRLTYAYTHGQHLGVKLLRT